MKILFSTPRHVMTYDTVTRRRDVVATGHGFYGVSWSPDGSTLVLGIDGYHGAMATLEDYAMSDNGYLAVGLRDTGRFLSAPHQVLWVDDGGIAVTNTGRNAVARIAVDDLSIVQRRYEAAQWDRFDTTGALGCHYNSLFFDGSFLYMIAHNFGRESFIAKLAWPSLDLVERIRVPGASGIHNLWIDGAGRWMTCFSEKGALIDARSGEWLWDCRGEGYLRGLAATKDYIVAGHSDIATRDVRETTRSGLWVLDRRTMKVESFIFLGHFGSVHDLRILDEPDECHSRAPLAESALGAFAERDSSIARTLYRRANIASADVTEWSRRLGLFILDDGKYVARDGHFALMTRRGSEGFANGTIRARLHMYGESSEDHAALVGRYGGPEDLRQYASIFQTNRSGVITASLWVEDGGWRSLGAGSVPRPKPGSLDLARDGLPIELSMSGDLIRIAANGQLVAEVRDRALTQGAVGIRALGSSYAFSDFQWKPA